MNNKYIVHGGVTEIFLFRKTDGLKMSTFVSTTHLERLLSLNLRWYPHWDKSANAFYVRTTKTVNKKNQTILMHRWLINAEKGLLVDHINHDTLDNTDGNLRQVDRVTNGRNRKGANRNNKSSGIRNVGYNKKTNKWMVIIEDQGKLINAGSYADLKEAEQAAIVTREEVYARKVV